MCARLCLQPSEKDRRRQKLADRCPCTRLIRLAACDFCAHMPIADDLHNSDYIGFTYSWEWIGRNPNLIGFWPLDSTEFGSNWIWISIALDELGLDYVG